MRLIRLSGLALLATMATIFIEASSAMANPTALCKVAESPCAEGNQVKSLHAELTLGSIWVFDGTEPNTDILCLSALTFGEVLKLSQLQEVHFSTFSFTGCGVVGTGSHTNCKVSSTELPYLVSMSETIPLEGSGNVLNGGIFLQCTVFGFIKLECEYDARSLLFNVKSAGGVNGHGMLNATGTPLIKTFGGSSCPAELKISEGLLEPLVDTYVEL